MAPFGMVRAQQQPYGGTSTNPPQSLLKFDDDLTVNDGTKKGKAIIVMLLVRTDHELGASMGPIPSVRGFDG